MAMWVLMKNADGLGVQGARNQVTEDSSGPIPGLGNTLRKKTGSHGKSSLDNSKPKVAGQRAWFVWSEPNRACVHTCQKRKKKAQQLLAVVFSECLFPPAGLFFTLRSFPHKCFLQ